MGDQMASACGLKQQNADEGTLLANSTAKFPTPCYSWSASTWAAVSYLH